MIEELRRDIEARISEARLEPYPFPHLIIQDFFPDDVFAKIIEYNPFRRNVGREWIARGKSKSRKTGTPYYARKQINLHRDDEIHMNEEEGRFWNQIRDCFLGDHWFERTILTKYRDYFVIRFGELIEAGDFFDLFRKKLFLQRHEPGYFIGPHTDVPTRVFTCIFSFADRKGFEEFGTQLCVHKDRLTRCWGNDHYTGDDFIVKKVAAYEPNSFLLFFKTRQSFHAVKAIDETVPNQRYGMQFQFYEAPAGLFEDLSEPELLVTRHSRRPAGFIKRIKDAMRGKSGRRGRLPAPSPHTAVHEGA